MSEDEFSEVREIKERLEQATANERGKLEKWFDWLAKVSLLIVSAVAIPWVLSVEDRLVALDKFRGEGPRFTESTAINLLNEWEEKTIARVTKLLEGQPPRYLTDQVDRNSATLNKIDSNTRDLEKQLSQLRLDIAQFMRSTTAANP